MENIKLQTLKRPVEKPNPNVVIEEIALELKNIHKAFKPTVQTRRVESYDVEEEEKLSIKQQEEEIERLREFFPSTRELLNLEINRYKKVFDDAVKEYEKKDEYDKKDQQDLKKSDEMLQKKMSRFTTLQNIKRALDQDVKTMVKQHEKTEKAAAAKLKTTVEGYRQVVQYLEKELDYQRKSHEDTIELFRKLEKTLRDTIYKCENAEERVLVLQDELNRTKTELHRYKNKLYAEEMSRVKSSSRIRSIERELEMAEDRAESAERSLSRLTIRRTPSRHF